MDITRRRFDSISFALASSSPSSLHFASARSSTCVSSRPSPIARTYSLSGSCVASAASSSGLSSSSSSSDASGSSRASGAGSSSSFVSSSTGSSKLDSSRGRGAMRSRSAVRQLSLSQLGGGLKPANLVSDLSSTLLRGRSGCLFPSVVHVHDHTMCGIAGYSLSPESRVDRTLAAQALLAGIAERGADAVGYAYRGAGEREIQVHKQQSGASALLGSISVPARVTQALVHVRDYTKGHPTIAANNHPVRHGAVVGIHNGIILNDDDLFERHRFERWEPEMTVDSEAIFALVDAFGARREALEQLRGALATGWLDERRPDLLFLARGVGRPLWLGHGREELFFASTPAALEVVERTLALRLRKRE